MERPHVPDLKQLSELEDSSDEEEDEQHLLTILKKLQSAKSSLDISKQRKRKREGLNEIYQQYVRDSKAIVERYEQRWKSYLTELARRNLSLKEQCGALMQKHEKGVSQWDESLRGFTATLQDALQTIRRIDGDIAQASGKVDIKLKQELHNTRREMETRLEEIRAALIRAHERCKDDKLIKIVNAFIATL